MAVETNSRCSHLHRTMCPVVCHMFVTPLLTKAPTTCPAAADPPLAAARPGTNGAGGRCISKRRHTMDGRAGAAPAQCVVLARHATPNKPATRTPCFRCSMLFHNHNHTPSQLSGSSRGPMDPQSTRAAGGARGDGSNGAQHHRRSQQYEQSTQQFTHSSKQADQGAAPACTRPARSYEWQPQRVLGGQAAPATGPSSKSVNRPNQNNPHHPWHKNSGAHSPPQHTQE